MEQSADQQLAAELAQLEQRRETKLTTGTVARLLGCSVEHVRRLIEAGDLDAIDIALSGRRKQYRIRVTAFRRYLSTRERRDHSGHP